jgi:hypothetical protein
MYTYGQPRTGNDAYASWINDQFGDKVFRGMNTQAAFVLLNPG